ncbi:endonuclease MutS2 [Pueribacillus theae]|uniref:Endonuclease MutS2 n=1 Tax=Pueribacillus theae TaxID=2171751 RepID=A0A2U1K442_9BACI|nr:endonuclease MutS2 [Pueribacillus theae]PWA12300.1 endonuclease MutS2 [Pueribacillus theae]
MQKKMLRLLEFNKIKERLTEHAATSLGKELAMELEPCTDFGAAVKAQEETDEAMTAIRLKGSAPFGGIRNIRAAVKRAEIGGMLNTEELLDVSSTIYGGKQLKRFIESFEENEVNLSMLSGLAEEIIPAGELEAEIKRCIDSDGQVLDSATPGLRTIRQQLRSYEARIREKLETIVRSSSNQKMLSDAIVTIRNERYVIPVKQEYRSAFGGIIHDQSSSGATLFIEPESVVMINNQLREAKGKERQEVEKILTALSNEVASFSDPLLSNLEVLAKLDFIFAKALYGKTLHATKPKLNENGYLNFKNARHPLIPKEDVVPITVELGKAYDSIVITGPNTGGKTVTLKTIGLLTIMAQSGLQLPVEEGSEASIFEHVFADIGDEQSIEQNLSTFSSHMTNIISILDKVNFKSLVLFDELGAGTDPQEGAALAISILDYVKDRGARVVATTHYSELKAYAYNREGVINASVEFNVETLKPTYKLLIGIPGRSNAFEISKRLGLNEKIIEHAKQQISSDTKRVDKMITSLEETKKQAEMEYEEAKILRQEAEKLRSEYEKQKETHELERDRILLEAEEQAKQAVESAMKEAEAIIKELRSYKVSGVKEHQLIDAKKRLEEAAPHLTDRKEKSKKQKENHQQLSPGDEVEVTHLSQKGYIVEKINEQEYLVQIGIMKVNVNAGNLKKVKTKETANRTFVSVKGNGSTVKTELDLRGKRYEDAKIEVDRYLDDAVLAGYSKVNIIHGKGTGALRKGVQEILKKHPNVKGIRMGGAGEGGSGVTVVDLK